MQPLQTINVKVPRPVSHKPDSSIVPQKRIDFPKISRTQMQNYQSELADRTYINEEISEEFKILNLENRRTLKKIQQLGKRHHRVGHLKMIHL